MRSRSARSAPGEVAAPNGGAEPTPPRDEPGPGIDAIAELPLARRRHLTTWISGLVLLAALVLGVAAAVRNERFGWGVVADYLADPRIRAGFWVTVWLTAASMAIGIVLGVVIAVARGSRNVVVGGVALAYIWFFRGTPVLVQLIFWYNLAALVPEITVAVPFGGPHLADVDINDLITPLTAALLGLGLNEGAYMAEIVRAGVNGVDRGQLEAGRALGMRHVQILRVITLPQAMRIIIPPTGNEVIGMLKTTSLVSVIALADLLYSAQSIYSVNFQTIPLLIVICLWYLVLTSLLTLAQSRIERRFSPDLRTGRGRRRRVGVA